MLDLPSALLGERAIETALAVHVLPCLARLAGLHSAHINSVVLQMLALCGVEAKRDTHGCHCLHFFRSDIGIKIDLQVDLRLCPV